MQIPNDPTVWIVLIVVVALGVGFALWRRYNVVVRRGDTEVSFQRQEKKTSAPVTVLKDLEAKNSEFGNVTGLKSTGGSGPTSSTIVLENARLENTKMGDITGVEVTTPKASDAG